MKKITPQAQDGYIHIIGEFELVRMVYGEEIVHEPRWLINIHHTAGAALPADHIEDDRIEEWWPRIVLAQRSGILYYLDGETAMREFRITLPLPLDNPIFIFHVMGETTEITGHEDTE